MQLTILADVEENLDFWKDYTSQYNLELDATFVYKDDSTSYNIRRIKKENQVVVVTSFPSDRYYEKFVIECAGSGIPAVILNSPLTYTFIDSYGLEVVTYNSDEVYPVVFNSAWYGIKTNGKFVLSNNRPTGVSQPIYYQDISKKVFAMRVVYRNLIFLNWTVIDNTLASRDLFMQILKGFKGVE